MTAWALFAFAGRDAWAVGALACGALLTAAVVRPGFSRQHRAVDVGIAACLGYATLQLLPLPAAVRAFISPAAQALDRAVLLAPSAASAWRPVTIDPASTITSLALGVAAAATFWSARAAFERGGGLRATVRGIVWLGLALAVVTFVQRALSPHLFYGIWKPVARTDNPSPLGPFLSRNDLATWLILAIPLAAGAVMAHVHSHTRVDPPGMAAERVIDSRMAVSVMSLLLMTALLLASASRSGIVGAGAGLFVLLVAMRRRMSGVQAATVVAGLLVIAAAATAYVNVPALTARFGDVLAPDLGRGRIEVWRQVWPLARDFWQTGVGLGAFQRGMIVYQRRPFELFINQAHNQYLQLLVEGGVPLVALGVCASAGAALEALRRLRDDRTPIAWMRAGAIGGIAAVAVQGIWDTGIERPANVVLLALVAAVALHSGAQPDVTAVPR